MELSNDWSVVAEWETLAVSINCKGRTRLFSWNELMEYSKTIATIRVRYVIPKFSKFRVLRANVRIKRGAKRIDLKIVPIAIAI